MNAFTYLDIRSFDRNIHAFGAERLRVDIHTQLK